MVLSIRVRIFYSCTFKVDSLFRLIIKYNNSIINIYYTWLSTLHHQGSERWRYENQSKYLSGGSKVYVRKKISYRKMKQKESTSVTNIIETNSIQCIHVCINAKLVDIHPSIKLLTVQILVFGVVRKTHMVNICSHRVHFSFNTSSF